MTHDLRHYALIINKTIFRHQNPVTGLLPAHQISGCEDHAWIRDNVYSIMSVWALSMAYKRNATRQNHEDKAQRDLDHVGKHEREVPEEKMNNINIVLSC